MTKVISFIFKIKFFLTNSLTNVHICHAHANTHIYITADKFDVKNIVF